MTLVRGISGKAILVLGLAFVASVSAGRSEAGTLRVLHSFGGANDGSVPLSGLISDTSGNLYGTTNLGGASGFGIVFKLTPRGRERALYSFSGQADGGNPEAGLAMDAGGNLYGATDIGGAANLGVIFKLTPRGREIVLHSFTGGSDGSRPTATLFIDVSGNLYGTTANGGAFNKGVVFKLTPKGRETVLYSFTGGNDGSNPFGGVIMDSSGNLFGATTNGGASNSGVVFKLTPKGREIVLHSFVGGNDGNSPYAAPIIDASGNLYGTTTGGGASGFGIAFKLTPRGREAVLHSFTGGNDGGDPQPGLIADASGNFYGTAFGGGASNNGIVFKLTPRGRQTVLYSFTGGNDGGGPLGALIVDPSGNLYGTTENGGAANSGTVFKLSP